ncbi:peptidylprolyl isomerase [Lysinibacillus odysseyi]|uniref:Peptidyl-prolyl cis-trans isomerase n=1 Tax=Lysinibacillus odysseyi 34hs-1 = NBRC 100172 TaxID=1220589 RepID=A0A0A3IIJ2_9BACI|nr:peptidylprolyl isomerase [Lysinibacillus odysseyi]KGR84554.1 peptidylprolyl isomerase [Lysinibacillus odysseyi 34hs-1 = NBRC 100172]
MFKRSRAFYVAFGLLALVSIVLAGCGTSTDDKKTTGTEAEEQVDYAPDVKEKPVVTITMENGKKIVVELDPAAAPNTVANFISLVEDGFYDGLTFHRVIPGFMIQGGDPAGNGLGGPDYTIKGEFTSNGFENNLKHERGVISMARAEDPDSASSQFFIMVEEASHLDEKYAAFGKVIEGMETVDAIVAVERDASDKPLEDQKMKKVEVDTKGFDYPDPVVQK